MAKAVFVALLWYTIKDVEHVAKVSRTSRARRQQHRLLECTVPLTAGCKKTLDEGKARMLSPDVEIRLRRNNNSVGTTDRFP